MINEPTGTDSAHATPAESMVISGLVQVMSLKIETVPPVAHPVRENDPPSRGTEGAMQPVLVAERLNPAMVRDGNCGFCVLHKLPVKTVAT